MSVTFREAGPGDAARIAELIRELGGHIHAPLGIGEEAIRANLEELREAGELPLVATVGNKVVGLVGRHLMVSVHRAAPLGRIPVLVVAKEAQGHGIGRMLVRAVEDWCREKGGAFVEVTSNDELTEAHAFYEKLGFERTSARFLKTL